MLRHEAGSQQIALHLHHLRATIDRLAGAATRALDKSRAATAVACRVHAIRDSDRGEVGVRLAHPGCRGRGTDDISRFQFFRLYESARRYLKFPSLRRFVPEAPRHRIQSAEVEVPPLLVGLSAVEERRFARPRPVLGCPRLDTVRTISR